MYRYGVIVDTECGIYVRVWHKRSASFFFSFIVVANRYAYIHTATVLVFGRGEKFGGSNGWDKGYRIKSEPFHTATTNGSVN